jgi:hypothetical protein
VPSIIIVAGSWTGRAVSSGGRAVSSGGREAVGIIIFEGISGS